MNNLLLLLLGTGMDTIFPHITQEARPTTHGKRKLMNDAAIGFRFVMGRTAAGRTLVVGLDQDCRNGFTTDTGEIRNVIDFAHTENHDYQFFGFEIHGELEPTFFWIYFTQE